MKVALVNNQQQLGGAETVIGQLRAGLRRAGRGSSLHVAWGRSYPSDVNPLYPRVLSWVSHTRLHPVVERLFPRCRWTDRAFRRLAGSGADLIHLHNFHGDYATIESLAEVARRKPVVWTFHAGWGMTGGCDHPQGCERYRVGCGSCPQVGQWPVGDTDDTAEQLARKRQHLAGLPVRVVAPSRYLAKLLAGSPVGGGWEVRWIPNGVDAGRFRSARRGCPEFRRRLGLEPGRVMVLVVNRDFRDGRKGWPLVREALAGVASEAIEVVLVGGGSEGAREQLPATVRCQAAGYVTSRDRLAEWLEAAEIFLFASVAETFPCVVLEAMAAECCVVATPTSGVVEQIESPRTGLLSEAIEGESLAGVLREAIASPQLRRACGAAARAAVLRQFSEEQMIGAHLRWYDEIVSAPAGGGRVRLAA